MIEIEDAISASAVATAARTSFFREHFGPEADLFQEALHDCSVALCPDFNGGLWEFYELSNGGAYLAPASPDALKVTVHKHGFSGALSADAAGVVVTLFALRAMQAMTGMRKYFFLFSCLRNYALQHPQRRLIFAAID